MKNVYDLETFFEAYMQIRDNPNNYNSLLEQPALFRLLGPVKGKRILDLGCGFGDAAAKLASMGAACVKGIDISEKMLSKAKSLYSGIPGLEFERLDMAEAHSLSGTYDAVTSSLAVHYVEDFGKLACDVFRLLEPGGVFVFSQEHPMTTAPKFGPGYTLNPLNDKPLYYNLADYGLSGARSSEWLGVSVGKYHRTFTDLARSLIGAGFCIADIEEPLPSPADVERNPQIEKEYHKPSFLLIKCQKR
ncbi:MAG: class I SAM-dependent methyltransferase [Eubacteriaceae bacterium]|jgi:SAM-dependent methyltransferase|nr:class I SAM-dependent methyltransferase [Eubacteriaceae bacterium]